MISGSASMLEQTQNPANLREQVTTPGGSTAEGLKTLYEYNFFRGNSKSSRSNKQKKLGGNNMILTSLKDYTTLHNGVKNALVWFRCFLK